MRFLFSLLNGGESCVVCGKSVFLIPLCKECSKTYFSLADFFKVERCSCCGKELISAKSVCLQCRENPVIHHSDFTVHLFSYRLWNKELLFLWKIESVRSISHFFAMKLSEVLLERKIEFVVPVPPRKGKIQKNGWDQIEELAQYLHFFYGFKILRILQRLSSVQQKKLNRLSRLETIESAYTLEEPSRLKKILKPFHGTLPEKVALIDDVSTTGSTVECCAKILKNAGIKEVEVFTLFGVD